MSRSTFLVLMLVIVALILIGMWIAWRARARRDAAVVTGFSAPTGEHIAEFSRVFYISTNAVGDPITRVAVPSLRYRGYAEVFVHTDGLTLQVRGEEPVYFAATQLQGSGLAGRRPGKAVERGGLALMRWNAAGRELESSFRFDDIAEQQRFLDAIDQISGHDMATPRIEDNQEGTR